MSAFLTGQASRDASARSSYEPIPTGDHPLTLIEWTDKPVGSGSNAGGEDASGMKTGHWMISAKFEVIEGPSEGKCFYFNYNYMNSNQKTVDICGAQLKQLVIACGEDGDQDVTPELLNSLVGRRFVGYLTIQKAKKDSGYDDSNSLHTCYSEHAYLEGIQNGTVKQRMVSAESTSAPSAPAPGNAPPPPPKGASAPPPAPATSTAPPPPASGTQVAPAWAK